MRLTISDKILLYLFEYREMYSDYAVPETITQQGVADAVGISVTHIPRSMDRLESEGYIAIRSAHVKNSLRKKKTYYLTMEGKRFCMDLRDRLGAEKYEFTDETGPQTLQFQKIFDVIKGRCSSEGRPAPSFYDLLMFLEGRHGFEYRELSSRFDQCKQDGPFRQSERPFFGRTKEMEELSKKISKDTRVVIIVGEPGIGKTSFITAFFRNASAKGSFQSPAVFSGIIPSKEDIRELMKSGDPGNLALRPILFDNNIAAKEEAMVASEHMMALLSNKTFIVFVTALPDGVRHIRKTLGHLKAVLMDLGPLDEASIKAIVGDRLDPKELRSLTYLAHGNPKKILEALDVDMPKKDGVELEDHQKALLRILRSKH